MNEIIEQAADQLFQAESRHEACGPVRDMIGATDLELAYAVQEVITKRKIANGEIVAGHKIGLTSLAVQKQIGVDQPDFGVLYKSSELLSGDSISMNQLMQPRIETEIAFILKKPIPPRAAFDVVAAAIDYGVCSLEIAGSRIAGWDIRIADTVADNASASHYVLGKEQVPVGKIDLEGCAMRMWINGEVRSEGVGSACLGNPLNAVLWLSDTLHQFGTPLEPGHVVLSGALGPMVAVNPGDHIYAEITGLGSCEITIEA
ncbi:MAG: 2-keto-4-pentenoate hydratase [Flavobacteriales bacterium]|nr:2-keto-4-pentenoate hydratase [Flavobacteriales bacterium]